MYLIDEDNETLDTVARRRQRALALTEQVTRELMLYVREGYKDGLSVTQLARRAGVQRRTIYDWVK